MLFNKIVRGHRVLEQSFKIICDIINCMQMMLPKHWETIDSFNNLNNAPEILCNMICLAKYFLTNFSREGLDRPINYTIRNSAHHGLRQGCFPVFDPEPTILLFSLFPLGAFLLKAKFKSAYFPKCRAHVGLLNLSQHTNQRFVALS